MACRCPQSHLYSKLTSQLGDTSVVYGPDPRPMRALVGLGIAAAVFAGTAAGRHVKAKSRRWMKAPTR